MQRCERCGQTNYNTDERCAYCGAYLYISVNDNNQDENNYTSNDFTDDIIKELSQTDNEPIDYNDNPFNQVIEENLYTETQDTYFDDDFEIDSIDTDDEEVDIYVEEDVNENKKPHIIELQNDLKKKIKRNKKLEKSLGLFFKEINVDMKNLTSPINITGYYFLNPKKHIEEIELSVICYDILKNKIERNNIILKKSIDKEFKNFSITIHPNIHKTAMIILLPEEITQPEIDEFEADTPQVPSKNFTTNTSIFIEQIKEIERKIGMKIDNTSIIIKSKSNLEIVGEIYIDKAAKYSTIKIVATCYDKNNNIIASQSTNINTKLYLGFDTLKLVVDDVNINQIERIKVYPTLQGL